ncbi:hypothetical protein ACWDOP_02630 [Nocardia sp. NPDC003693]
MVSGRVRMMHGVSALLVSTLGIAGCSTAPQYGVGFTEVPETCAAAVRPAEQAIAAFVGALPSQPGETDDDPRSLSPRSQHLQCDRQFGESVLRQPFPNQRAPMWRNYSISYFVSLAPTIAGEPTRSLMERRSSERRSPRPTPAVGIGQDAVTWLEPVTSMEMTRATVEFVIGNLTVKVQTSGRDWSGNPAVPTAAGSPELRAELEIGARSIAKALALQAPSDLPKAMLTEPSHTRSTTAPSTTTARPAAVWDPCSIPQRSLAAAGLEARSEINTPGPNDSKQCFWSGAWYHINAHSHAAPFEWSVYDNYVNPAPVTIGNRHAVQAHWRSSDLFCVLVFELPGPANIPLQGGRTLKFEASLTESHSRTELCDELTRVVTVLQDNLPPST